MGPEQNELLSLEQSFASLRRSSDILASLSFPNGAVLPRTVLASTAHFESHLIRDLQPHERGLFRSNKASLDSWAVEDDATSPSAGDAWTATKRTAPKRIEMGRNVASPLKDRSLDTNPTARNADDPDRCLRAAQKLLDIYPLPRASEHVEALHSQWIGVVDSIADLEGELRQPLARTGPAVQHDESYYRLLSLEDEIKREELELLALQQFKRDRESELAALKPIPKRKPGPAARTVPSVVRAQANASLGSQSRSPATLRTTHPETQKPMETALSTESSAHNAASPVTVKSQSEPNRRVRPSIPSAFPTPRAAPRTQGNPVSTSESLQARVGDPVAEEPSSTAASSQSKPSTVAESTPARDQLPASIRQEDLDLIASSIWRSMGEILRPWAKQWVRENDQADERFADGRLGIRDTTVILESVLNHISTRSPSSPSSTSISSYATSQTRDDDSEPSPPSPSTVIEVKLLHLLLSTFSSARAPTLPPSLPALPIVFRHPGPDTELVSSPAGLPQAPCLAMNPLKVHLSAFAAEKGWAENMGTTAIYALISRQIVRIDRQGKEGACVGFKCT
ncbi:uncharacterized protein JCM15063_004253 [Sporobolomyces koalae]|uniref:uncharacterized protein n=1 Tax=Sporobolomyces koalae TaxID=500713 RepID=UPI00316EDCAD